MDAAPQNRAVIKCDGPGAADFVDDGRKREGRKLLTHRPQHAELHRPSPPATQTLLAPDETIMPSFSLAALTVLVVAQLPARGATTDLGPYRGLGTWVDVFDYTARTQPEGAPLPVTPDSVDDMAALGWPGPAVNLSGFVEPFDTWADMRHLLVREAWPQAPRGLAYFCNALADESAPRRDDPDVPRR